MVFSRGGKIQTKDFQLPTVLLRAAPRDTTYGDYVVLRIANIVYSIYLFKENVCKGSEEKDEKG